MSKDLPQVIPQQTILDDVCEMIVQGLTYREIADKYKWSLTALFRFIYDPKHSERTRQAREYSAHVLVDQAEMVLAQAKDNPQLFMVSAALAHHYRWKASMLNKRSYQKDTPKELEEGSGKKEIIIKVIEE